MIQEIKVTQTGIVDLDSRSPVNGVMPSSALPVFNFELMTMSGILEQGRAEEKRLNEVLNRFLERIAKDENPQLFKLVAKLGDVVVAQNLPAVADNILNATPTLLERVIGFVNKKSLVAAQQKAFSAASKFAAGKTKTLLSEIDSIERLLAGEQARLAEEIVVFEKLKQEYSVAEREYESLVKNLQGFLAEVKKLPVPIADSTPGSLALRNNHADKVQGLESRVLALESTYTRLPADQETIRQLQQAGLMTLQETRTDARFASIKMTLLVLHGALVTQSVQRLADQGAALDANLMSVRHTISKRVVDSSANAPGNNRVAQAEQIKTIMNNTAELVSIVEQARLTNVAKFEVARKSLSESRQILLAAAK
jgi:hypothetical protein